MYCLHCTYSTALTTKMICYMNQNASTTTSTNFKKEPGKYKVYLNSYAT